VSVPARRRERPSEAVAGFLATIAIFASCVGVVYRPLRITPVTIALALLAAAMGGRHERLAAWALGISAACFIVGTFFAILTNHPIF
jgi:hypothetical protein